VPTLRITQIGEEPIFGRGYSNTEALRRVLDQLRTGTCGETTMVNNLLRGARCSSEIQSLKEDSEAIRPKYRNRRHFDEEKPPIDKYSYLWGADTENRRSDSQANRLRALDLFGW